MSTCLHFYPQNECFCRQYWCFFPTLEFLYFFKYLCVITILNFAFNRNSHLFFWSTSQRYSWMYRHIFGIYNPFQEFWPVKFSSTWQFYCRIFQIGSNIFSYNFRSFVCRSSSYILAFCSFRSQRVGYCPYSNTTATTPSHFFSTCLLGFSDLRQPQINLSPFFVRVLSFFVADLISIMF